MIDDFVADKFLAFINNHETDIDEDNWDKVYDDAYTFFRDDYDIGFLTDMFREVGLYPEEYFTSRVKDSFAFGSESIKSIKIPVNIIVIGTNAFYNSKLENIDLSEAINLKQISSRAFSMSNLKEIILPESTQKISPEAFSYCKNLEHIYIPENCLSIAPSAFSQCMNPIIEVHRDSYAHRLLADYEDIILKII